MADLSKSDREKIRKKTWYEANKSRLKAERDAANGKVSKEKKPLETSKIAIENEIRNPKKIIVLTFLAVVVAISSGILVIFTVEILGEDLVGWTTAILLEVGILSLAVMKPTRSWEWWIVKVICVFFVGVSFYILHAGTEKNRQNFVSQDQISQLKIKLAGQLMTNAKGMPIDYLTKKNDALKLAAKELNSVNTGDLERLGDLMVKSNLAIRVVLLLLNLIFCHAFVRLIV